MNIKGKEESTKGNVHKIVGKSAKLVDGLRITGKKHTHLLQHTHLASLLPPSYESIAARSWVTKTNHTSKEVVKKCHILRS